MHNFQNFILGKENYRICSDNVELVKEEIIRQTGALETYIELHKEFQESPGSLKALPGAPEMIERMASASAITGLGPSASFRGGIIQTACEKAILNGVREVIIENSGDIYIVSGEEIIIGLNSRENNYHNQLALRVTPDWMPISVCSTISCKEDYFGMGSCDLACIVAEDMALANSASTLAYSVTNSTGHMEVVMNMIMDLPGIKGILLVQGEKIGISGDMPELIKSKDPLAISKIASKPAYFHV